MNPIDAKELLDAIEPNRSKLSEWELKFVKNIRKQWVDKGRYLKGGQPETLQRIYRKSQGG